MSKGKDAPTTPYEKLLDHPLVGSVIQNSGPVLAARVSAVEEEAGTDGPIASGKRPNKAVGAKAPVTLVLTREQEYHDEVFFHVRGLAGAVERLDEISIYLGRFPNSPTFKRRGITMHRWVQYHYSNYLTGAVTVYDTALLLTNAVFMLGLSPKVCSEETVTKNRRVQRTKASAALNKLKEVTRQYREPRNLHIHRGESPVLGKLDEYENILWMHRAQERLEINTGPRVPVRVVETLYGFERRRLVRSVRDETEGVAEAARGLFDSLVPVYAAMTSRLK